jgi:hypothetical protein
VIDRGIQDLKLKTRRNNETWIEQNKKKGFHLSRIKLLK